VAQFCALCIWYYQSEEAALARERRRLAAIVAADVVGYSRLMGRDETGTLARLRAHRKERFEPTVARHGGRLVKLTGDGALAEFPSAVDALSAAIEFQQAMAEANREQPEETRIVFRIGLHLGDLIVDGDDLYGDGVNVAARLESEAPAGGIVISGDVHNAVAGRLKANFSDLGGLALKNIERPIQAFRVGWIAADWQLSAPSAVTPTRVSRPLPADVLLNLPDKPSVAVLPFQNMSGDPEQEYFADGMVEDIITALSRFKELVVIARNSTFIYKGRAVDIAEVARDLGVRYVLEGSVRKGGKRVRITGQLIDAATRAHLWADRFDGALEDVFDLQDRITESVVGALQPTLRQAEIERTRRKSPASLDAYDYLLRALPHMMANTVTEAPMALTLLEEALRLDPDYAQAHAQMAIAYGQIFRSAIGEAREKTRSLGLLHARRALAVGGEDSAALAPAAYMVAIIGQDWAGGRAALDKAVALNPNSAAALMFRSNVLAMLGEAQAAIADAEKALRLSPLDPTSYLPQMGMVIAKFTLGENDEAASWARKAIEINPRYPISRIMLMAAECRRGNRAEAEIQFRQLEAIIPGFGPTTLARMCENYPPELCRALLETFRIGGFLTPV
jgi:TolB-like protein/class 3 adenylate cyclase/Tfp pilus assembly protein PilF